MNIGTLPKIDGNLFYLPPPLDMDDVLAAIYFYSDKVRIMAMIEIKDERLFLHYDGMRIPFDPDWNLKPVMYHEENTLPC